jgi:serine/threonine-protein kinase
MSLSGPDWVKLNTLLDAALDLDPAQRGRWLESLPPEYESLRDTLRSMLFRQSGVETLDVMRRAPSLSLTEPQLAANDLVGPYRLLRPLGAGGMATVWLAERADGTLQRQVALKLPRTSLAARGLAERLNRERDILAALEHPNIARLYDAGADANGRPYLALEYVDGVPLDVYAASNNLSTDDALDLFVQMARAVAYAHNRLIVHQDLKPSNVLVKEGGDLRLLDFGIAHLLQAGVSADDEGSARYRAFTPRYAAPEQLEGQPATVATDIYSLGIILKELLAGRRALHDDLTAIVDKAMRAQPNERYQTVNELVDDIERHRSHLPIRARPNTGAYRTGKFLRRHGIVTALAASLLLAILGGSGAALWQSKVAIRERDRAVRALEEASATNQFWNMVFTEAVSNDETLTMPQLLERSERMAEQAFEGAPLQYAVAVEAIASLYVSHGKHAQAAALIERALQLTSGIEGAHRTDWLKCKYALAIASLDRSSEADRLLVEVIDRSSDRPDLQQYCLHRRAIIARDSNDAAGALSYISEAYALSQAQPIRDEFNGAHVVADLAYAYELNGESDFARSYYQESWDMFTALGRDKSHEALTALNNWGNLEISAGNFKAALDLYARAVAIAQRHSPSGEIPTYLLANRASASMRLARYDEAMADFRQVAPRAEQDQNPRVLAMAMAGVAEVHRLQGNFDAARHELDRLASLVGNSTDVRGPAAVRVLTIEGRLSADQGHLEDAHRYFNRAVQEIEASGVKSGGLSWAYIGRSTVRLMQGDRQGALADIERAMSMATAARGKAGFSAHLGYAAMAKGNVHRAMGQPKEAAKAWRLAVLNLKHTLGLTHPDTQRAQQLLDGLS